MHRIDMMIVSNSFLAALMNVNGVLVLAFPKSNIDERDP
jgi:hypothetical protein